MGQTPLAVINFMTRKRSTAWKLMVRRLWEQLSHLQWRLSQWFKHGDALPCGIQLSYASAISQGDRPYTLAKHLAVGGSNSETQLAPPQSALNSTNIYTYPYTGAPMSTRRATRPAIPRTIPICCRRKRGTV